MLAARSVTGQHLRQCLMGNAQPSSGCDDGQAFCLKPCTDAIRMVVGLAHIGPFECPNNSHFLCLLLDCTSLSFAIMQQSFGDNSQLRTATHIKNLGTPDRQSQVFHAHQVDFLQPMSPGHVPVIKPDGITPVGAPHV